jgi:hypothetical protein
MIDNSIINLKIKDMSFYYYYHNYELMFTKMINPKKLEILYSETPNDRDIPVYVVFNGIW